MGAVLKAVELLALGVGVGSSISLEVIEADIRDILDKHDSEFQLLKYCKSFLDEITKEGQLIEQLQAATLYANSNWQTIVEIIETKRYLLGKMYDNYSDIFAKGDDYAFSAERITLKIVKPLPYIIYGLYQGWDAYRMYKAKKLTATEKQKISELPKEQQTQIQMTEVETFLSEKNLLLEDSVNRVIEVERTSIVSDVSTSDSVSTSTSLETVKINESISEASQPKVEQIQQGKPGYNRFEIALKVLSLGVIIYYDVKLIIENADAMNDLKTLQTYFKDEGKFDQIKKDTVDIMKLFASDVFNLVAASRALALDLQQIIYLASMMTTEKNSELAALSSSFDPDTLGMTYELFTATKSVVTSMDSINPTKHSEYTTALEDIKSLIKPLDEDYGIFDKFSDYASTISTLLSSTGITVSTAVKFSDKVVSTVSLAQSLVSSRNQSISDAGIDMTGTLTSAEKTIVKSLDSMVLSSNQTNYKVLLGPTYHGTTTFDLDDDDKKRCASMITAFTDNFYSDYDADNQTDTDGTTIYGITISDSSLGFVNGDLVTMMANRTTQDDIIPVYITDTEAETAFEEEFVAQGMDLEPTIFTDKQTALDNVVIRYQRFFIEEQSLTYDDVDYDTLGYAEGLMIQVDDSVYGIEKNMKTSVYSVSLME